MSDLKITVNHLKNYLGTGLKLYVDQFSEGQEELMGIINDEVQTNVDSADIDLVRPIMYRLTDLDKFIPELGFVPLKRLVNDKPDQDSNIEIEFKKYGSKVLSHFNVYGWIDYDTEESRKEHLISVYPYGDQGMIPFSLMKQLFSWHFWPFGEQYFHEGLVIDKLKQAQDG